jgi:hypothetical protein
MAAAPAGESFKGFENSVDARVDDERGAVASRDHSFLTDDEQGPFGHALAVPAGSVSLRNRALGLETGE